MGESGSEASYFIPEPRNFAEVTILSYDIKKTFLKSKQNEIKYIINNHTFLFLDPEKGEPVTPCMNIYKDEIHSDGGLENIKVRIVVKGDLNHKELVGDNCSPTASMRNLK